MPPTTTTKPLLVALMGISQITEATNGHGFPSGVVQQRMNNPAENSTHTFHLSHRGRKAGWDLILTMPNEGIETTVGHSPIRDSARRGGRGA